MVVFTDTNLLLWDIYSLHLLAALRNGVDAAWRCILALNNLLIMTSSAHGSIRVSLDRGSRPLIKLVSQPRLVILLHIMHLLSISHHLIVNLVASTSVLVGNLPRQILIAVAWVV